MLNGFNFGFLGGGAGSKILAAILYSDPFTYTLDASGNTLMTNKGSFADAAVFSGSGVELQADNELPIPIANNGGANSFLTLVNGDGTVEQIGNSVGGGNSEELVVNGDFSDGIGKWTSGTANTSLTIVNEEARSERVGGNAANASLLNIPSTDRAKLIIGRTYRVNFDIYSTSYVGDIKTMTLNENGSANTISSIKTNMTSTITISTTAHLHISTVDVMNTGAVIFSDNISIKEILPASTTYDLINKTVLEAMPTTKELTTADLALIEADTSLMTRLSLGATDTGLSLVTADVFGHYAFMEYIGADCYDTKDGTIATITNYLDTVRDNVDFNPKGNQGIEFERASAGVPTAFNNTQMNFHGDGYADLGGIPDSGVEFIIEESVGAVFYSHIFDLVNLTTWTNGVEGAPVAHTPEGVNYLLGKGLYPKVTADPYTTYTQDYFRYTEDAIEIANYDALQAYNDYIT